MPFKGLSKHVEDIEALMKSSPETQVIIDHWGFFLQPATGFGERSLDDASWTALLKLKDYPQVHVKISALFRVSTETSPFPELSERLKQLLSTFGSARLLWGSDFPYATEHSTYSEAVMAPEAWPVWAEMSEEDRTNLVHDTAARLYGLPLARSEREL
ncbi:ligI [Symbiodinium pilosum]|uniref:LigI protein n=1 Tax=Symbiodinium pilosum TaxID=2952 RepID=A0A812X587_SYMPI|nr:ligI [Symbiodinium pilosum]